jgi:hypothetical protein
VVGATSAHRHPPGSGRPDIAAASNMGSGPSAAPGRGDHHRRRRGAKAGRVKHTARSRRWARASWGAGRLDPDGAAPRHKVRGGARPDVWRDGATARAAPSTASARPCRDDGAGPWRRRSGWSHGAPRRARAQAARRAR